MENKKCDHKDGWVLSEAIVISSDLDKDNDNIIAEFECNTIGCKIKKKFGFDIINIKEV